MSNYSDHLLSSLLLTKIETDTPNEYDHFHPQPVYGHFDSIIITNPRLDIPVHYYQESS